MCCSHCDVHTYYQPAVAQPYVHHCTDRFGSTAKVLARCMLKYYRISERSGIRRQTPGCTGGSIGAAWCADRAKPGLLRPYQQRQEYCGRHPHAAPPARNPAPCPLRSSIRSSVLGTGRQAEEVSGAPGQVRPLPGILYGSMDPCELSMFLCA